MKAVIIQTTTSSKEEAKNIAEILIKYKLAACIQLKEIESLKLEEILKLNIPKALDADIFYNPLIVKYLDENVVLTPHPKEFISLLKLTNIANISI